MGGREREEDTLRGADGHGFRLRAVTRQPGRVLLLCGLSDYRAHVDRMAGCRGQPAEVFTRLTVAAEPCGTGNTASTTR
ncbi:protein of unknown function [Paraburkholderia kururiensis]